jgi:ubiquinone/menaquinone biosynthesis C-methylase UbiE
VLFRLREEDLGGAVARAIVALLPGHDALLARDLARMEDIRALRAEAAQKYFGTNAANWAEMRSLHVREEDVEAAMLRALGSAHALSHIDLGTGTGRILQLLAPLAAQSVGLDSSRDMLAIARGAIEDAGLKHVQVRHGDLYALPFANESADLISIHQVLHFLDDPQRALAEAARALRPGGRLMIVDFAPHDLEKLREEHAHRRLGIASEMMAGWLARAGLRLDRHDVLPPPWRADGQGLTVSIWLAARPSAPVPRTATIGATA